MEKALGSKSLTWAVGDSIPPEEAYRPGKADSTDVLRLLHPASPQGGTEEAVDVNKEADRLLKRFAMAGKLNKVVRVAAGGGDGSPAVRSSSLPGAQRPMEQPAEMGQTREVLGRIEGMLAGCAQHAPPPGAAALSSLPVTARLICP